MTAARATSPDHIVLTGKHLKITGTLYLEINKRTKKKANPVKKNQETIIEYTKKWAPKVALFAVIGVTGLAAIYAYRGVRKLRDIDLTVNPRDFFNKS